jgi:hypothetical protein
VVPPLFAHLSRHGPQRTDSCLSVLARSRGLAGGALLSLEVISSRSFRVFFADWTYELLTNRSLSGCAREPLLVPSQLFAMRLFVHASEDQGQTKKPFILPSGRRAELSCCHLFSLLPHDNNLSEYIQIIYTLVRSRGPPASSNFTIVISSRSFRAFFAERWRTGFSTTACSLSVTTNRYSSCQRFCCYVVVTCYE